MEDELVETGLGAIADGAAVWKEPETSSVAEPITVAVNPGLTTAGKDAAKVLIHLPEMTHGQLASLAREIAMDIKTHDSILLMYKLSNAQYEYLKEHNDFFKAALHSCAIEWHSALTTPLRSALSSPPSNPCLHSTSMFCPLARRRFQSRSIPLATIGINASP